jgi:hypothetical protein
MLTSCWRRHWAGFGQGTPNGSQLDPVQDRKVTIRSCIKERDGNEGPIPSLIRQERSKSGPKLRVLTRAPALSSCSLKELAGPIVSVLGTVLVLSAAFSRESQLQVHL